jgi:hypothetical protein
MTNFLEELEKARLANDWDRVQVLWKELCELAEIEETSDGEAGNAAEIAKKMNAQQKADGHNAYGKKV